MNNVSLIAHNWTGGNSFIVLFGASVHPNQKSDLYVGDYNNHCTIKIFNYMVDHRIMVQQ